MFKSILDSYKCPYPYIFSVNSWTWLTAAALEYKYKKLEYFSDQILMFTKITHYSFLGMQKSHESSDKAKTLMFLRNAIIKIINDRKR